MQSFNKYYFDRFLHFYDKLYLPLGTVRLTMDLRLELDDDLEINSADDRLLATDTWLSKTKDESGKNESNRSS